MSKKTFAVLALAAGLGACAQVPPGMGGGYQSSALRYSPGQAQQVQSVQLGHVLAVQRVIIRAGAGNQALGSGLGALAGGYVGSRIGNGNGSKVAAIIGALAGSMAGNAAAQGAYGQPGLQITVQLDHAPAWQPQTIAITQAADVPIRVGEKVEILTTGYGQPARVVPLQ